MAKAVSRSWYRVAVATRAASTTVHHVLASGEHVGQAIADAERAVAGGWVIAMDPATADEIPLGEAVGKGHVVRLADQPVASTFAWPRGIVPALESGATGAPTPALSECATSARHRGERSQTPAPLEPAAISGDGGASAQTPAPATRSGQRELIGWLERPDPNLFVIEAQTDAEHMVDLFLGLVEQLPAADNLEVRLLPHFEHGETTDVWLTSRVDAKRILRLLDDLDCDLLYNGHVALSVYLRAQKATLRLTEHKTVVWMAENRAAAADVARWFSHLKLPRVGRLMTVDDIAHFHYRPARTRNRKQLGEELYRQRLRLVDTVAAAP